MFSANVRSFRGFGFLIECDDTRATLRTEMGQRMRVLGGTPRTSSAAPDLSQRSLTTCGDLTLAFVPKSALFRRFRRVLVPQETLNH